MTTIELAQHPELADLVAAIRQGESIDVVDHGRPVMRCVPAPTPSVLRDRLQALQRSFTSPAYPGNSVVDMRRESR
jgi:antitoxin (DNA-binding transcriptional repressor) of toxin-antitoxin stability system